MDKKAQLTIFIILGFVLLMVILMSVRLSTESLPEVAMPLRLLITVWRL